MPEIHNNALPNDIDWAKIVKAGSSLTDIATRLTTNLTDFPAQSGQGGKFLRTNGTSLTWEAVNQDTAAGTFYKAGYATVAFTKTGNGTAQIKAGTYIDVGGKAVIFTTATNITMPTLSVGDYAIWVKDDGTIQASDNFTAPPGAGTWRRIGGFHYAYGGNATARAGGNTTQQINEFSFWDLKFRPNCPDPRGMTLVAGKVWFDIYMSSDDVYTGRTAPPSGQYARGSRSWTLRTAGGSTFTGTAFTWYDAVFYANLASKRLPTQQEFIIAAYGTTEVTHNALTNAETQIGSATVSAALTSRWGLINATGTIHTWSADRGGPNGAASYTAVTALGASSGHEYNAPNAAILGGRKNLAANSGSCASDWSRTAITQDATIGARLCCDHLMLD